MAAANDLAKQSEKTPRRTLSVRVYRDYGSVHVEFGVAAECYPENEHDQMRIWQQLLVQVNDAHDDYAKHELPNVNVPPDEQIPVTQTLAGKPVYHHPVKETFEYEALEIYYVQERVGGEFKVRTRGESTPYKKYGAVVPPELVERLDLYNRVGTKESKYLPMNVPVKISAGRVVELGEIS